MAINNTLNNTLLRTMVPGPTLISASQKPIVPNNTTTQSSNVLAAGQVGANVANSYLPEYQMNVANAINGDSTLAALRNLYNTAGAGYNVNKIDVTPMIESQRAAAQSKKDAYTTSYQNTRQNLLDSIKRFQEQNEIDRANQRESYLNQRSDLENQAFMADRASRISAASRGLSGSGLQQLSQLGNLLSQSSAVSQAARSNQKAQDALITALRQAQEQSDKNLTNLESEYANQLNTVDTDLANIINQIIYNEDVRYENARQQAAAQAASQRNSLAAQIAQRQAELQDDYNRGIDIVRSLENSVENQLKELTKNGTYTSKSVQKEAKNLVANALNLLDNAQTGEAGQGYIAQYGLGQNNRDIAATRYDALLNKYAYLNGKAK